MSDEECIHGMTRAWCSACRTPITVEVPAKGSGPYGGRSRQLLFDDLCDLLDIPHYKPGPGSAPSRVFAAAAARADVETGSMPQIGEAIAVKAGLAWGPDCDNRGMSQKHPTAVSREGVGTVVEALRLLAKSNAPA